MRNESLREQTRQGLLEERLPLLFIVLPKKFPLAARNYRLTWAFDVHATLQHLLTLTTAHAQGERENVENKPVEPSRATSLLNAMIDARTCEELGLNFVYCACETHYRI